MKIVIPIRNTGTYEKLRYALRSMLLVYPDATVLLVGGKPAWFHGEHLPHPDYHLHRKEENIRDKVIAGAPDGDFLFANDDHILHAPITTTYDKGLLSDTMATRNKNGTYYRLLHNTLQRYGDVPNVDTHSPMWMTGEGVRRTSFPWPQFGIGFKTCYAQENGIASVTMPDCKVDHVPVGRDWWSMTGGFDVRLIKDIFPNKSKFEI